MLDAIALLRLSDLYVESFEVKDVKVWGPSLPLDWPSWAVKPAVTPHRVPLQSARILCCASAATIHSLQWLPPDCMLSSLSIADATGRAHVAVYRSAGRQSKPP